MAFESDKVMFEVYREEGYARHYRVVYFTELDEDNKETEINAALAGEHFYDGFIADRHKPEAERVIAEVVDRLNGGEVLEPADLEAALAPFTPTDEPSS